MVAIFEIVFLIVCAALGLWVFSRTSTFRNRVSHHERHDARFEPRQGVDPKNRFDPPNHGGGPDLGEW